MQNDRSPTTRKVMFPEKDMFTVGLSTRSNKNIKEEFMPESERQRRSVDNTEAPEQVYEDPEPSQEVSIKVCEPNSH
jgi:hypothetical protein